VEWGRVGCDQLVDFLFVVSLLLSVGKVTIQNNSNKHTYRQETLRLPFRITSLLLSFHTCPWEFSLSRVVRKLRHSVATLLQVVVPTASSFVDQM